MSFLNLLEFNYKSAKSKEMIQNLKNLSSQVENSLLILGAQGTGKKTFLENLKQLNSQYVKYKVVSLESENFNDIHFEDRVIYTSSEIKNFHKLLNLAQKNNIKVIEIPKLEDRKEDLLIFANYFIQLYSLLNSKVEMHLSEFSKETLSSHEFKRGFFELERIIQLSVEATSSGQFIELDQFIENNDQIVSYSLGQKLDDLERSYILKTLTLVKHNRTKAADLLGISIRTLRNKLHQYKSEGYI